MSLLNVERIKLTSTRSPWWCAAVAIVLSVGLASLVSYGSTQASHNGQTFKLTLPATQIGGARFGLAVVMIMAALAVTNEYRFGIIRTTFQAAPRRISVMLAKGVVVALVAAVLGEIIAFLSLFVSKLISSDDLPLDSSYAWRVTAGVGLVYLLAALLGVAVGFLLRQSAAAIALLLLFPLVVENLVQLIPSYGDNIHNWMPFVNADRFLDQQPLGDTFSAWGSLAYFAVIVLVILGFAAAAVTRRDA